jgi:putative transposase
MPGETPSMAAVKRRWNAKLNCRSLTKCASGQAIKDVGAAFASFFRDCKKCSKQRKFSHRIVA